MTINASDAEIEAAKGYEALFVPSLFEQWTHHVLDAGNVISGDTVLDIGCGTGVLSRAAHTRLGPTGSVTGIDPTAGMLAVAKSMSPYVNWRQEAAEEIGLPDASVDVILSQFAMMFFADRDAAAREMIRVLKPGGRLAIAVWNGVEANPVHKAIGDLFDQEIGSAAGDALRMPFSLGSPADVSKPFETARFTNLDITTHTEQAHFPSLGIVAEGDMRGWLPLFNIHLSEDEITRIAKLSEQRLQAYAQADGSAAFPTSAHILSASK